MGLRRWAASGMLALSLLLALGGSASAEVLWCEDDPIITVEGRTVHLVSRFAQTDLAAPLRAAIASLGSAEVEQLKVRVFETLAPYADGSTFKLAAVPLCASAVR